MPDPLLSPPPESIEGYRIGARLGESGALVVHAGTSRLDLPVEAFLVRADALVGGFEADDFLAGVRRAASVHHESLLPFVTGGRQGDLLYAIAKSAEGSTLDALVVAGGALPEASVLTMASAIAGALVALERGGLRHGDLTPQRILRAGPQTWVVGPPRLLPVAVSPRAERWQAPEEARGSENGVQSDLFALGMIVVYAVNGAYPLGDGVEPRRVLRDWKPPDLVSMLRRASPETRSVVAKLLAPEPAKRFASAAEALRAINDAAEARPETAPIALAGVPTLRPMTDAAKRSPGRLYVESRLGEAMIELDDDATHVGANEAKNVRAQAESFAGATIRLERGPAADVVNTVLGELRVNGRPATSQSLADGDRIEAPGIAARYERTTRAALRATGAASSSAEAPPGNPLAATVTVVAILGTIAALAWGAWSAMGSTKESSDAKTMATRAQQLLAEDKRRLAPADTATPAPTAGPSQTERAAREAYETAVQWARRHPADARTKYYAVWQRFPDTAHGLLARLDAHELDRGRKPVRDRTLEDLLAAANAPDGVVDDETLSRLRTWAEEHPGTLGGERAHLALVKAMALQRGRFDGDIAAIRAAVAKKDWREALTLIARTLDYVPPNLRDEVLAERRRVEEGMGETLRESPAGRPAPGDGGAGRKPKDPAAGPSDEPDRNRKAEETFRGARRLMDGGKEAEALEAFLVFLREYKDTPNGAKYDPEARGRISELSTGPAGIVKLFRGKAEKAEKGRWRITYDFADAAQLQDFRDVAAFEAPPRAAWKIDQGAVRSSRGSGALVLDAVFAANEISTAVTVIPDHPHDLGVMYMDPSEQRRFYLFTLQNTFFTLGRGDAAKAFLENAIVLFGPNMWRDTPPGQLGFVRKCGSDEPLIRPSESTPIRVGKSEGEMWMKFEGGRSLRGSAYGDTRYEFPGVTPGLFVLGSAGQFDDFVVEGIPDRDWVQKRWRAILSGL
jgi:hypothetical protein